MKQHEHNLAPTTAPEHLSQNVRFTRTTEIVEGEPTHVSVLHVGKDPSVSIRYDSAFVHQGIATEPGSGLINQPETTSLLGRPAGERPEDYISDLDNVVAITGNHFGWQRGSFVVENGVLELLHNDKEVLTGTFATLCMDASGSWSMKDISVDHAQSSSIEGIALGVNGTPIVRGGEAADISTLLDDPRIKADLRNVFDFSDGTPVPPEFFQDIRKFSPEAELGERNPTMFRRMVLGQTAVLSAPIPEHPVDRVAYERLQATIHGDETHLALDHLKMDTLNGRYRLGVVESLPEQRMPLVGLGSDKNGELVIVAVDGRQPGSVGVSIRQLADLMIKAGIQDGILGCGGGDVCVVEKRDGQTALLNSPASKDANGERVSRLAPNVMVIPLH